MIWDGPLRAGIVIFSPDRDVSVDDTVEQDLILGVEAGTGNVSIGLGSWSTGDVGLCCRTPPNWCGPELDNATGSDVERVRIEGGSSRKIA